MRTKLDMNPRSDPMWRDVIWKSEEGFRCLGRGGRFGGSGQRTSLEWTPTSARSTVPNVDSVSQQHVMASLEFAKSGARKMLFAIIWFSARQTRELSTSQPFKTLRLDENKHCFNQAHSHNLLAVEHINTTEFITINRRQDDAVLFTSLALGSDSDVSPASRHSASRRSNDQSRRASKRWFNFTPIDNGHDCLLCHCRSDIGRSYSLVCLLRATQPTRVGGRSGGDSGSACRGESA